MKKMTWSIGRKLTAGFAAVISLTLAVGATGLFALTMVNTEVETTTTVSTRLETLSNLINISLLEARRSETAFFLRYRSIGITKAKAQYVPRVQAQVTAIHSYADEGISLEMDEADRARFRQIKALITGHEAAFLQAVALVEQHGHFDAGLEGQFRAKIHQIEEAVAEANLDQLTIDILSIRRHEKDYLLRGDPEDIDQVVRLIAQFKQDLRSAGDDYSPLIPGTSQPKSDRSGSAAGLSAADQARLDALADEYLALFQQLAQVDTDLDAAIDRYREQAQNIEPLVAEIRANATADFQQSVQTADQMIRTATRLEIITLALEILLGFGIALALSRSISRPVRALTEAATVIAGGDLSHQVQIASRDEIGVLAAAFNQMMVNLRDLISQVRESEDRYRRLVELSFDAVIIYNNEGNLVYVNPPGVKLLGAASAVELIGKPILEFTHPDSLAGVQTRVQQLKEGKGVPLIEEKFIRLDGTSIEVEVAAVPITYQGHPAVQTVIRDITERKRAQEVKAQLAAIVESSNDAIIGKTLDGMIVNWNRGAEDLYGYSAEEVTGRSVAILVPPDRADELSEILERLKQGERIERFETVRVRKDGQQIEVAVTISPIKDARGKIIGASTIAEDITERKARAAALEKERARIARDLHDSLGQSLTYLRLKLDEFTSTNSLPEIRPIRPQLTRMQDVANEAYELVRGLLAAARPSNSTDLATALQAQAQSARNRARFKVNFIKEGQPRPLSPIVQHQVLYIFQEALNNVVRHANARRVDFKLVWAEDILTIILADDGCGFDPNTFLAEGHFGLTIMQERAEEINGFLSITSRPTAGTELTLRLPLAFYKEFHYEVN
jgi:PAS domain S-box-containing protein